MQTSKLQKTPYVILIIAGTFILNFMAKYFAASMQLPVWLDSLGTCIAAYIYGPLCGAIVGAGTNISYGFFDRVSLVYSLSGMAIGAVAGWLSRKGYFEHYFKMSTLAIVLCFVSVFVSTPLNIIFYDGYCGNVWGDAFTDMLKAYNFNSWIAASLGEFTVDILDKIITVIITFSFIKFNQFIRKKAVSASALGLLTAVLAGSVMLSPMRAEAAGANYEKLDKGFFTSTIYNERSGLPGGEANAVEFSRDGYVWVGTYSGLYKFDGSDFNIVQPEIIRNVNCLYEDAEGRMWIGTNDAGLMVLVDGIITNVLDETDKMCCNSITCAQADDDGYYYIGTKEKLDIIQIVGGIRHIRTVLEVDYASSITICDDNLAAIVTDDGKLHVLRDGKFLYTYEPAGKDESFTCASYINGALYLGTSTDKVYAALITEDGVRMMNSYSTGQLRNMKKISEGEDGYLVLCADNGAGFLDSFRVFHFIDTGIFNNSINDCGFDYQDNFWLASTRQGLCMLYESTFSNILSNTPAEGNVVNAVISWQDKLYLGTDSGLVVMDRFNKIENDNHLAKLLENQRIRNFLIDNDNHLWIAISKGVGLVEVQPSGDMKIYNEDNGMISNRFRSAIQLKDGTIAVASDDGIDFIENESVVSSITKADGLANPMILSFCETDDGILYAGTDGSGIVVIKDKKIQKIVTRENGLSSDVVLRISDIGEGVVVVTSNSISTYATSANLRDNKIKVLNHFPYSNNFAVLEDKTGKLWVLSSAGVFVAEKDAMLSGEEFAYSLYDFKYGLNGSITANSWSYMSNDGLLYIPCSDGCYLVDTVHNTFKQAAYRMTTEYIYSDSKKIGINDNREILLDGESKNFRMQITVPNFTSTEVLLGYMLEGYDSEEHIISTSDSSDIKYTNLPGGEYKLIVNLYNGNTKDIIESVSYTVKKDMHFYEHTWFTLYLVLIYGLFIAWITWALVNRSLSKEREKREQYERDIRLSNETIMTIAKTVDAKDLLTSRHSERVAYYSRVFAKVLGWSAEECETIYKTGLLHDIGKIGIPDAVLNKPDKLSDEEYLLMKTHVDRGAEILKGFTLVKGVDLGTRYHHERYDGSGYPQGLKGEEIPIQARLISITDAFDAMTQNRVYRKKLDIDFVLSEMKKNSGTQFDPDLLEVFLRLVKEGIIKVGGEANES